MTAYRFRAEEVAPLLDESAGGYTDIWDAVQDGYKLTGGGLQSLLAANTSSLLGSISLGEQQAVVAAGYAGLRPELFTALRDLPGVDILATVSTAVFESGFELDALTTLVERGATELLTQVSGAVGTSLAIPDVAGSLGTVVGFVVQWASLAADWQKSWWRETNAYYRASLECLTPGYSAAVDEAQVRAALQVMTGPDWTRLFVPEVRPINPDFQPFPNWPAPDSRDPWANTAILGFTCCKLKDNGGRAIAPLGSGVAPGRLTDLYQPNFYADDWGFGLVPMAPVRAHRAIIVPYGGIERTYDSGRGLPRLAGIGQYAWRLLWNRSPLAFSVDGDAIADAWAEYLGILVPQIANNFGPCRGPSDRGNPSGLPGPPGTCGVCDDWKFEGRARALKLWGQSIGMQLPNDPRGIQAAAIDASSPVAWWREFSRYQTTLLSRVTIAYVDARSCHPAWRERVRDAQRELLSTRVVCDLTLDAIPDPEFRAAVVEARKRYGASCYTVGGISANFAKTSPTSGPSMVPLGEQAPAVPEPPDPDPPPARIPTVPRLKLTINKTALNKPSGGGAGAGVALAALAAVMIGLGARR